MDLDCRGWYALQTLAGRERAVKAMLENKSYETFLPLYLKRQKWADRVASVMRPLFPNYIFCRLTPDVTGRIVTTPGIVRIVGIGKTPVEIDHAEVEAIRRITTSGLPSARWQYLQAGQSLHIVNGPLRGLEGIFVREGKDGYLVVSVHLLQRSVAVLVKEEWVIPEAISGMEYLH